MNDERNKDNTVPDAPRMPESYRKVLEAMPEPYRSQLLYGDTVVHEGDVLEVIDEAPPALVDEVEKPKRIATEPVTVPETNAVVKAQPSRLFPENAVSTMPKTWLTYFNLRVIEHGNVLGECRTRTTTSDRIIQPTLIDNLGSGYRHPPKVRWPGEMTPEEEAEAAKKRESDVQYSQIDITTKPYEVLVKQPKDQYFISIEDGLDSIAQDIGLIGNIEIFATEEVPDKYYESILLTPSVIDHRSEGMSTVSGYIDIETTAENLKCALFHLPQGYRQRAKWYMSEARAKLLLDTVDENGNEMIDPRHNPNHPQYDPTNEILNEVGVPYRLLGKPIVCVKGMHIDYVVIGDLSRGYLTGKLTGKTGFNDDGNLLFTTKLGGQVLQPAAIKVCKLQDEGGTRDIKPLPKAKIKIG